MQGLFLSGVQKGGYVNWGNQESPSVLTSIQTVSHLKCCVSAKVM